MRTFLIVTLMGALLASISIAQTAPDTLWTKKIDGHAAVSAQQTHDGGLIVVTSCNIIKCNDIGDTLWTRFYDLGCIGGRGTHHNLSVVKETLDLGFVVGCNCSDQYGFSIFNPRLLKIDSNGDSIWVSVEVESDRINWIEQTSDQAYIAITYNNMIKYTEYGDTLWTKNQGGNSIKQTHDNGYVLINSKYYESLDDHLLHLLKTNEQGDSLWMRTYNQDHGNTSRKVGIQIIPTTDNGYTLLSEVTYFESKTWLLKINESGDTTWTKSFNEVYRYMQQTADNGYILIGNKDEKDLYIAKLNEGGEIQWTKMLNDWCGIFIEQTLDNGYIAVAYSSQPDDGNTLILRLATDPTNIEQRLPSIPSSFTLEQNYPNPFNPVTIINYRLPMSSEVQLSIYNLLGQKVATLVDRKQKAGTYQVEWDASAFASGIYYYRIQAGEFQDVKKMILLH